MTPAPDSVAAWAAVVSALAAIVAIGISVWTARRQTSQHAEQNALQARIVAIEEARADVEHDRALFARYDSLLSEEQLRAQMNLSLHAGHTRTQFTTRLDNYLRLSERNEGRFLIPAVQTAFRQHVAALARLDAFIGRHFFTTSKASDGIEFTLSLYPGLKDHPEKRHIYEQRRGEILEILDLIDGTLQKHRLTVKVELSV